ncbi:UNVERIFIED_CONTAM: Transposon Tf2-11 polyprotein [Sesamum angustifolium]|uniref:Transposon Tf2-11 polyprotein n=1 Tax=Sesamum angustifolium TaxID=2727405 RepID=A0AAW2J7F0_9LAMI
MEMGKDHYGFYCWITTYVQKHDAYWVVVDRLTKSAHFLPIRKSLLDKLAELYVSEIVITCTAFHPQTDGQSERTIQMLEDMMRACVIEFRVGMTIYQMEFAYNNNFHSSVGPELVRQTVDKIQTVKKCLKAAQDRQKSYADKHCREMEYEVGEKVFLKVSPWRGILRFGKQGKLSPRYIGPYEILERVGPLAYRLALPAELSQIHDVSRFYVTTIRSDPSHILHEPEIEVSEGLAYVEEPIEILDR